MRIIRIVGPTPKVEVDKPGLKAFVLWAFALLGALAFFGLELQSKLWRDFDDWRRLVGNETRTMEILLGLAVLGLIVAVVKLRKPTTAPATPAPAAAIPTPVPAPAPVVAPVAVPAAAPAVPPAPPLVP